MLSEIKIHQGFLFEPTKIERHRFRAMPAKTRLIFSKKQALKKQVWENARKKGWLAG